MTFLSLLLFLPLVGGNGSPAPMTTVEADSVIRRYDLETYAGAVSRPQDAHSLIGSSRVGHVEGERDLGWIMDPNLIQQLLEASLGEELEYEGRAVWHDNHTMIVRAPEALHARIQGLLNFVGEATSAVIDLQVDIINLQDGATPLTPTGLVDLAAANKLLAAGGGPLGTESYRLRVRPGATANLHVTASHPFIWDYEVEVAEQMCCFDPVVESVQTGLRMEVGAYPSSDGCNLSLLIMHGDATGPMRELSMETGGVIGSDRGIQRVTGVEMLQSFPIAQRTMALNTSLPDGKALVLRSSMDLSEARGTQYVIVRRSGARPMSLRSAGMIGAMSELHLVRDDALICPAYWFEGSLCYSTSAFTRLSIRDWHDEGPLSTYLVTEGSGSEFEILEGNSPHLSFMNDGTWMIGYRMEGADDADGSSGKQRGSQGIQESLTALERSSEVVNVSFVLERTGRGLSRQVTCDLPLRVGYPSAVTLGVEGTHLIEYNVEIASKSSVSDPVVEMDLDGIALVIEPRRAADGSLELRLNGVANLLRDAVRFDARSTHFAVIEERVFDRIQLNETVRFGAGGAQSVVLGNSAGGGEAGALKLQIQVR